MNLLALFSSTTSKVLGALLAASLIANVFLFWVYTHQVEKKVECTQSVKTTNKIATDKKVVIERRQENTSNEVQTGINHRIADLTQRVQDSRRVSDMSRPSSASPDPDGAGRASLFLSESDELACGIAVIKAEAWQEWYVKQALIRKEENTDAANSKDHRVSSARGRDSSGSVPGLGERMDLGAGSDEPIGAPSIPALLPQPAESGSLRGRISLADPQQVLASSNEGAAP